MAPFTQAIRTQYLHTLHDGTRVFEHLVDPLWRIETVPIGGYLLAAVLDAVIQVQADTCHPDPVHLSANFLNPSRLEKFFIHITPPSKAKGLFSNITAELRQRDQVNIQIHIIVGVLDDPAQLLRDNDNLGMKTILPPDPLAVRTPFYQHPSIAYPQDEPPEAFKFRTHLRYCNDRIQKKRYLDKNNISGSQGSIGIGFEDASWYELGEEDPTKRVPLQAIALFAELHRNSTAILPQSPNPGWAWYPTLFISIEFKLKLSSLPADSIAPHTFGVFTSGRHIHKGRHEANLEIWTAPCRIGGPKESGGEDWREKSLCVAIARQMAITMPMARNRAINGKGHARGKETQLSSKL